MASYEPAFKQSVAKDLRPLPRKDVRHIMQRIRARADNPRPPGCEKLSAQERYRVRQGSYRIIYEVLDGRLVVLIVKVAHRRKICRG